MGAEIGGREAERYEPIPVAAGSVLRLGAVKGPGSRAYRRRAGRARGAGVPRQSSDFHVGSLWRTRRPSSHGRRCAAHRARPADPPIDAALLDDPIPPLTNEWEIAVLHGPHAAPDFFTLEDIDVFFATAWKVHYNSSRTGVRLIGPKPGWARTDGGEAGLHPSNIHDTAYAIGTVDYTGDMPVILGPDGPSLGGFVCPATIVGAELWKLGQLKAGRHGPLSSGYPRRCAAPGGAATSRDCDAARCASVAQRARTSAFDLAALASAARVGEPRRR